jgi:hypothetical protein
MLGVVREFFFLHTGRGNNQSGQFRQTATEAIAFLALAQ